MNKEEESLYDKLINRRRYNILRSFLEKNKNDILKALDNNVKYKDIYNEFIESSKIDVKYNWFCKVLSDFRTKYIYNLSEEEYKKQMKAISQPAIARPGITTPEKKDDIKQSEILAAKISESEQPAQPKEQEKVENKKDVPADEKPSGKIPKWKEEGFNSLNEYFDYLQKQPKSIPEEKKGFVYETSIVK